jgi:hypothetical protein
MAHSRKEIKDSVLNITRQDDSDIGSLVNEWINITLHEINDPGWAYPRKNFIHHWNFLRRKATFSTVADQSDYVLGRDVDKISIIRQTESPTKLRQIRDEEFFELIPDPTATGNPKWYRLWETEGVSTQLAADDTIDVVSSSTSDAGSGELTVSVSGYDTDGIWRTDTYALNGTTTVSGTITFDGGREVIVSKQKDTTGKITVTEKSGGDTLVVLGPNERNPLFKVLSLYQIPSSAITMYLEYYTYIPELNNDSDTPIFSDKWHYIVRLGALEKAYQYLNKEMAFTTARSMYTNAVRSMVSADQSNPDLIEHLKPVDDSFPFIHQRRSEDAIA